MLLSADMRRLILAYSFSDLSEVNTKLSNIAFRYRLTSFRSLENGAALLSLCFHESYSFSNTVLSVCLFLSVPTYHQPIVRNLFVGLSFIV